MLRSHDGTRWLEGKGIAWLSLHAFGRLFPKLIPLALGGADAATINAYQVRMGEMMAADALGYNFGDAFLHGAFLLNEVQQLCRFEKGECVQIFVDSCPLFGSKYPWWIRDATDAFGHVHKGEGDLRLLTDSQPWGSRKTA